MSKIDALAAKVDAFAARIDAFSIRTDAAYDEGFSAGAKNKSATPINPYAGKEHANSLEWSEGFLAGRLSKKK